MPHEQMISTGGMPCQPVSMGRHNAAWAVVAGTGVVPLHSRALACWGTRAGPLLLSGERLSKGNTPEHNGQDA